MEIIDEQISVEKLKEVAGDALGNLIKAVVDIEKEIIIVGGELHADEEALLLEKGSRQADLWGINIYPEIKNEDWIEFDSMINLKPSQGNRSRGVDDLDIRKRIIKIVNKLIKK